jgi:hypothetical protein
MITIEDNYILFGGMQSNTNTFEVYNDCWEPLEGVNFEDE